MVDGEAIDVLDYYIDELFQCEPKEEDDDHKDTEPKQVTAISANQHLTPFLGLAH